MKHFDKWFYKRSTFAKVLLLFLPFVNWIMEILLRISIARREKTAFHYVIFVVFVLFGGAWILPVIDLIYFLANGHLLFSEIDDSHDVPLESKSEE